MASTAMTAIRPRRGPNVTHPAPTAVAATANADQAHPPCDPATPVSHNPTMTIKAPPPAAAALARSLQPSFAAGGAWGGSPHPVGFLLSVSIAHRPFALRCGPASAAFASLAAKPVT